MTYTTIVSASASFSDVLIAQKESTRWEHNMIKTVLDQEALEDVIDILTAIEAEVLYREYGRSAFVPFDELERRER